LIFTNATAYPACTSWQLATWTSRG